MRFSFASIPLFFLFAITDRYPAAEEVLRTGRGSGSFKRPPLFAWNFPVAGFAVFQPPAIVLVTPSASRGLSCR